MFGKYENSQRKQWLIRLAASLAVATVLVFSGLALYNRFHGSNAGLAADARASLVQQAPQESSQAVQPPTSEQPSQTPLSGSTSNGTVAEPKG